MNNKKFNKDLLKEELNRFNQINEFKFYEETPELDNGEELLLGDKSIQAEEEEEELDIPDEDIEEAIGNMSSPEVTLKDITTFSNKDFDVVKFDVEGEDLFKMNKTLTEFPHTTDYPDYHPHTTIAYVKVGEGEKYHQTLDEPIIVTPNKVVYSKPDGTKKEYPFDSV